MSDQSRASGWHILRWAEAIRIENILIENVREFESWGPLGADGRPLKSKRGQTFQAFLNALKALNYTVDYRVLNAANYGDPTTRERLFIMARRGRKQIVWPEPTHTPDGEATLFGKTQRWRAAREIIDWNILGQSIFERKRPLAANTLKRIETGLRKYCGKEIEPFLVILKGTSTVKKVNDPVPAVTTVPYVGLCEPFLVEFYGHGRAVSVEDPIPTATTRDRFGVCQPFIIGQQSCAAPRSVKDPVPTIATAGAIALVEPFIVGITQTGSGAGRTRSIDRPLPTVVTKEEFALCQPAINGKHLDIRFRMLRPHELARAMSFDDEYKFHGSRGEQVKQIGNAVPVMTAQRLCEALLQ
jgi:DNA (cytosine-5)-methyltransferase 1